MDDIMKGKFGYENLLELMPFASDEISNFMPFSQNYECQQYYTPPVEDIQMPPFPPSLPHWVDFQQTAHNSYIDYFAESGIPQLQMEMPLLPYIEPETAPDFYLSGSSFGAYVTQGSRSNATHSRVPAGASLYSLKPRDPVSRKRATDNDRSRNLRNAEQIESLNKLLPHPKKAGKAKKLEEIIDHIKYLQLQLKDLSQSRLGDESTSDPFIFLEDLSQRRLGDESTSDPFIFLEGYGHYFVHELMMSNDSLEGALGKLMEMKPVEAIKLLQSRGLYIMPMHLAQGLHQSNFM